MECRINQEAIWDAQLTAAWWAERTTWLGGVMVEAEGEGEGGLRTNLHHKGGCERVFEHHLLAPMCFQREH